MMVRLLRRGTAAIATASLALSSLATLPAATAAPAGSPQPSGPTIEWDWSMPASVETDRPDDIAVDYPLQPVPGHEDLGNILWGELPADDRHQVTITACDTEVQGSAHYWFRVPAADWKSGRLDECQTTTRLPEGRHKIHIKVADDTGTAKITSRIRVKNILMVIFGDSYSAGTGYPSLDGGETPWLNQAQTDYDWDDPYCAKIRWGGFFRSAVSLEQADTRSNVTVLGVTCGGGTIDEGGLLSPQKLADGSYRPAQVDQVTSLVGDRKIDLAQLSIGGNDTGFGLVVETCLMTYLNPSATSCWDVPLERLSRSEIDQLVEDAGLGEYADEIALTIRTLQARHLPKLVGRSGTYTLNDAIQDNLTKLPERFERLDKCFGGSGCKTWKVESGAVADNATPAEPVNLAGKRVVQVFYPNLLRAQNGDLCGPASATAPFNLVDSEWGNRGVIHYNEAKKEGFIDVGDQQVDFVPDGIRTTIMANRQYGWNVLNKAYAESRDGGICSETPVIYNVGAALDPFPNAPVKPPFFQWGIVHPNNTGQDLYHQVLSPVSERVAGVPVAGPVTAPGKVRDVTANYNTWAAPGKVTVRWHKPASNGGSPVTRYRNRVKTGGEWSHWLKGTKRRAVYTDLAESGNFRFQIQARNKFQWGPVKKVRI